jgi:Uma2 family endonuclease
VRSDTGMAETATRVWTAEELIREGLDPRRYEIVDGELVELRGNGMRAGWIGGRLAFWLQSFLREHAIGEVFAPLRCRLHLDPPLERVPDLAFIRTERVPVPLPDVLFEGAPDLVIEVLSSTDEVSVVFDKAREYLERGVREVWLAMPWFEVIMVMRPSEPTRALDVRDVLESDVLPGFHLSLATLFETPSRTPTDLREL